MGIKNLVKSMVIYRWVKKSMGETKVCLKTLKTMGEKSMGEIKYGCKLSKKYG